jgi:hypothetical protein
MDSATGREMEPASNPDVVGSLKGRLWSDEPSKVDFLAFEAIAGTVADAVMDDSLDPLAIGLSGPWGSGKTTVLELIKLDLDGRSDRDTGKAILVVRTDPWRYDPATGAKESLISEVLAALTSELEEHATRSSEALNLVKKLAKRVDWAKAIKLAAKTSLALQIPSLDELTELIREKPSEGDDEGQPRGLATFRAEFASLMASHELAHVRRVAVLVDDLDRCLVDTVVETLEAIRLFLSVKGMAFVIAADEERVADAIRTKLPEWQMPAERPGGPDALPPEEPSKLYLHKIVQTTVPLPALGAFDTESYLLLLQLQNRIEAKLTEAQLSAIIGECSHLRTRGALDELQAPAGVNVQEELAFAHRLTSILYEKLQGNPRRIKRFLNDLNVRRAIAARRGIELDLDVVAKLMVLEVLLPDRFKQVLAWLRTGELRDRLAALEEMANAPREMPPEAALAESATSAAATEEATNEQLEAETATVVPLSRSTTDPPAEFDDDLVRWAKLPPDLHDLELSPYLHLAASFSGDLLVSQELPPRLRDLATQLLATRTLDRRSVTDDQLRALPTEDVEVLVRHLGRRARDRTLEQRGAVVGISRLAGLHPNVVPLAIDAFRGIPVGDIQVPTAIHLKGLSLPGMEALLAELAGRMPDNRARRALTSPGGHV